MPGKRSSKRSRPKPVIYCYDESLGLPIGELLIRVGYPIVVHPSGMKDEVLIPRMGELRQTWITKDNRSKTEHEPLLREANISVIWVRGLTHERRKRKGSIQKNVQLKDILRMLVNRLDGITQEIAYANGPRYFLLYTTLLKKDSHETFTTLRQVSDRLAGLNSR